MRLYPMEGRLKQKLRGVDGVLCWRPRHFLLDAPSRSLAVTDAGDGFVDNGGDWSSWTTRGPLVGDPPGLSVTRVSLEGARFAKAWTGINAFNGCGFDLVWASGRIWSLLCEDPRTRKSWVDALNLCVMDADAEPSTNADGGESRNPAPPTGCRQETRQSAPRETAASYRELPEARPPNPPPPPPPPPPPRGRREVSTATGQNGLLAGDCLFDDEEEPISSSAWKGTRRRRNEVSSTSDEWMPPRPPRDRTIAGLVGDDDDALSDGHQRQQQQQPRWRQQQQQQQQQQQRQRRRRKRKEETAEPERDSIFSGSAVSSSVSRPAWGRRGGEDKDRRTVGDGMEIFDGVDGVGVGVGVSGGGGGGGSSMGRRVTGNNRAREKSEALAKASAATWDQFQQLLEKSRESKARFDRTVDVAAEARDAPRVAPAPSAFGDRTRGAKRSDGALVSEEHPRLPVGSLEDAGRSRVSREVVVAALGEVWTGSTGSTGGSSTDRVSAGTSTSCARDSGGGRASGGGGGGGGGSSDGRVIVGRQVVNLAQSCCLKSDLDAAEQSRVSAATDVETSLLLSGRETSAGEGAGEGSEGGDEDRQQQRRQRQHPSSSGGGRIRDGEHTGEHKAGLKRPASSRKVAPRYRKTLPAEEDSAARLAQVEAELRKARLEVAAAVETEILLRRQLAEAVSCADSEAQQLRGELSALKVEVRAREEQEKEKEIVSARALAERERERERAREEAAAAAATAAAATAAATAAAAQEEVEVVRSRGEEKLASALEAAARVEREKAEAVRQREELEKALASEIGERRRVSGLLSECSRSEQVLRERLEAAAGEGDAKARLATMRSELEAVSLERDALAEELDQCISRLGGQAREVSSALRSRQQREIAEISSRCEIEKEALRERCTLEADERWRKESRSALEAQEMKLRAEAAAAARREAKVKDKQLREAKAEAQAAGEATRKDIEKLRALHAKRVRRLEAMLKEEAENLKDARQEIVACKTNLAGEAGDFQRWTEEHQDQSKRLLKELAVIQKKVDRAVAMEAEAREREGLAMSRLRKVMEEARLQRAEGAEVRRQLREALAELEADRGMQARRSRTDAQLRRAAEIARQEVAMLEAERVRWFEERRSMETALDRLKRLVYGPGNAPPTPNNTTNTAKNAPTSPWKPAGGSRVRAKGSRGQSKTRSCIMNPVGASPLHGSSRCCGTVT